MPRVGGGGLALAVTCLALPTARAQDSVQTATIELEAPPGCLSQDDLAAGVEELLGRSAIAESGADLDVSVVIEPLPGGFAAAIGGRLDGGEELGLRTIEADAVDCHALDGAVALVVGLLVDPEALALAAMPAPPAAARVVLERAGALAVPRPRPDAPDPEDGPAGEYWLGRFELRVTAGVAVGFGFVPETRMGGRAALSLVPSGGHGLIEVAATLYRRDHLSTYGRGSEDGLGPSDGDVGVFAGHRARLVELLGCYRFAGRRGVEPELDACGGVLFLYARSTGYSNYAPDDGTRVAIQEDTDEALQTAAAAELRASLTLWRHLQVGLAGTFAMPFAGDDLQLGRLHRIEGRQHVYDRGRVLASLRIDVGARFR